MWIAKLRRQFLRDFRIHHPNLLESLLVLDIPRIQLEIFHQQLVTEEFQ